VSDVAVEADGTFVLHLTAASSVDDETVSVAAPGFVCALVASTPEDTVPGATINVTLARSIHVRGRCIDEEGRPLAGASVSRTEGSPLTRTADDGVFDGALAMTERVLLIDCPERVPVLVVTPWTADVPIDVGTVLLRHGATIRGVLVDSGGGAVGHEMVGVMPLEGARCERWTWTDADGRFEVAGLPEGRQFDIYSANHGAGGGPGHHVGLAWAGDLNVRAVLTRRQ
jgi:hypothetical protein